MLPVPVTSAPFRSKVRIPDGKRCREIGVKIGKAMPISMGKASLSKLLLVMEGLLLATMLLLVVGNLVKLMKEVNSNFKQQQQVTKEINSYEI